MHGATIKIVLGVHIHRGHNQFA